MATADSGPTPEHDDGEGPRRIRPLGDALADQIAAGEVVERPASVVKELLENSIDAGARRVIVELSEAGVGSISVVDDGRGIHPDDLPLAVMRHATSKVRRAEDLVEIGTLGFRGEALASMAAVAHLRIRSRPRGSDRGTELQCRPGLPFERSTVGMPVGTQVELRGLFANVPARRKFLRSEATELGHVTQTVLRVALVQPQVHVSLLHGGRRLLELPAGTPEQRVEQVLGRSHRGSLRLVEGEHDGVQVRAWLAPAGAALKNRGGLYVVVRQRAVREPNIAKIVSASFGDALPEGSHPVACIVVEPPRGEVDVNVHPQKSEIRFEAPQRVYAAVREVLGQAGRRDVATRPSGSQTTDVAGASTPAPNTSPPASAMGPAASRGASLGDALDRWARSAAAPQARESTPGYRLRTRAADDGYDHARASLREQADVLHQAWVDDRRPEPGSTAVAPGPAVEAGPEYIGCLPGPVGLFVAEGELLAVDLRALRSHLVLRRLKEDLGGGEVAAQGLLEPVVVRLPAPDVTRCVQGREALARMGLHLEAFGDDAVIVRAVPAALRRCVDEPDVADLVTRVLPWLRVRHAETTDDAPLLEAMAAVADTRADPAPRLARRWLRELLAEGVALSEVPGLSRWSAAALIGRGEPKASR